MKIQLPRLGRKLRVLMFSEPQEFCPYCQMRIENGPYHEWDQDRRAWYCKTILEPRAG